MRKIYLTFLILFVSINLFAANYYVKFNASGTNDGSSWTNAFIDLQSALSLSTSGDSIFVSSGTYKPDLSLRTVSFSIKEGVVVLGGFAGNETVNQSIIDNRDFVLNETILSGDLSSNDDSYVHPDSVSRSDNSYHVVLFNGSAGIPLSSATCFDGFTIQNGNADATGGSNTDRGAGLFLNYAHVTIKNLVVKLNTSKASISGGAGLYLNYSNATIEKIQVYDNNTYGSLCYGGGMFVYYSNAIITSAFIKNNYSQYYGGGIAFRGSLATLRNSTLVNNNSGSGGNAIYNRTSANTIMTNVLVWENPNQSTTVPIGNSSSIPEYDHCLIYGSGGSSNWLATLGTDNGNNYADNPNFIDPLNDDYRFYETSKVVGTGNTLYGNNIGYDQSAGEPIPPPAITISKTSQFFPATYVNELSSEYSYQVSGINLIDDVTIVAPKGFKISKTSGDYSGKTDTLVFTPTTGTLSATDVYMVFSPDTHKYYTDVIQNYSFYADTQYVNVEGNGLFNPSVTADSLSFEFGYVFVSGNSSEKYFTFEADQLIDSLIITAPVGFEISKTSGDFTGNTSRIAFNPEAGGKISATKIYVRFSPLVQKYYFDYLDLTSGSYTNQISLSGMGSIPSYTFGGMISDFGNVSVNSSSTQQLFWIDAHEITDDITVYAPTGFEITKTSGDFSGQTDVLTFTEKGTNSLDVYVRFSPLSEGFVKDSIMCVSLNCDTIYLTVQGTGVLSPAISVSNSFLTFESTYVNENSIEQSFVVSGSNLVDDITITVPAGFEASTVSGNYSGSNSIILTNTSGTVPNTTIYVRFSPVDITTYYDYIILSTTNSSDKSVTVYGVGQKKPRYFVKADAVGNNDGSDWDNAFISLQSALSSASSGDSIFVAKGIYIPHTSSRSVSFALKNNVKIYGGFAGNEYPVTSSVLDARDFTTNETILSGDIYGNDNEFTNNTENSYHVVSCDASSFGSIFSTTILDGFTIQGGNANSSTTPYNYGGGLYIKGSTSNTASPTLKNINFKYNSASSGGAIYNYAAASTANCNFSISNSTFEYNQAKEGGVNSGAAIYNLSAAGTSSPTITDVVFKNNISYNASGLSSYGGAIYNWATNGGKTNPIFKNVLFYSNTVDYVGNAVYNRASTSSLTYCKPQFINATFTQNTSNFGSEATIYNYEDGGICLPKLINVIMWDENAKEIENSGLASTEISNSLIRNSGGSASWDNLIGSDLGSNIDADPMFLDMLNGDVTLIDGSPALNSGNSTYGNNIGYYQGAGYITPSISVTSSISDFGTVDVGNSSTEQSYIVSGSNLQADIEISAPTGFEITKTSSDYSGVTSSLVLTKTAGTVNPTTIYVRFTPTQAVQYSGKISHKSTDATTQDITVSGKGNTSNGIISGGVVSSFGSISVGSNSDEQSYYVKGIGLTADISISAPTGFEITKTSGDYSGNTSNIILTQTAGTVDSTVIFVRFTPTAASFYSGNIVNASSGVQSINIYVSGTGIVPPWIFVNQNALGSNNGSSWANAYTDLQSALSNAISGDSIFVAKGTYIPHVSDRTVAFNLKNGVKTFGGFAGNETITKSVIENRDFNLNETILSGDILGNDNGFANNTENSYHILLADAETNGSISSGCLLDGFTISGGNANDALSSSIYNKGAGIYCRAGYNKTSSPRLENLKFKYNTAKYGGAVYFDAYTTNGVTSSSMKNIMFENNTSTYAGGAVYNGGALGTCSTNFENIVFKNNTCTGYDGGGAVFNWGFLGTCSVTFKSILFSNNYSTYNGSAITNKAGQTTGTYGGTITSTVINSTFVNNGNTVVSNKTEGIGTTSINFYNTILKNPSSNEIVNYGDALAYFNHCLVEGSGGSSSWNNLLGTDGGNNIDEEPYFIDEANADVTLKTISPALNTGNTTYGNNIGYYQGAGVLVFEISNISDINVCENGTIPQITFSFADNDGDNAIFTAISSDETFVKSSNITITGTGTNREVFINSFETLYGSSVISIIGENTLGQKDTALFSVSINQKPVITDIITTTVNPYTSIYTIQILPSDNVTYDYWYDGVNSGSYYISNVTPGVNHTFNISKDGCMSDDYIKNFPTYLNNVPLEIVPEDVTTYFSICEGDAIQNFNFYLKDDSLHQVNLSITNYNIPDSAVVLTQLNDSAYSISFNQNYINTQYAAVLISANNVFGENSSLNINYEFKIKPEITFVNKNYDGSTYCINPTVNTDNYYYTNYSIDSGASWTNAYNSICSLTYGNYEMIAEYNECYSEPYKFTLYQYVNNVNLSIESATSNYEALCGTNIHDNIILTIADDTLQNVTVDFTTNNSYLDSIISVVKSTESIYTISFNDTLKPEINYSIDVHAYNNLGESTWASYTFFLSNAEKPIINNIVVDTVPDQWGTDNYCFRLDVSNVTDLYNTQVTIQGTGWSDTRYYTDQICSFALDNYIISISENACQSEPFAVNILGINELTMIENLFNVYPNPSNGILNVELKSQNNKNFNLEITDLLGKVVLSNENISENIKSIDMTNIPKGMYFVVVKNDKYVGIKKITLQ